MAILKLFICSILVLLLSARTQPRPLNPHVESRNLIPSFQASIDVSREALKVKMNGGNTMKTQNNQPVRLSPGGPDPVHHPITKMELSLGPIFCNAAYD
ncbi:hypothetical protein PVL29_013014 [Vitis rotundifolia]|uniref:Uncharacterized protein n=1 Tax=Vitis rotundifolia TaxID=103349 RepID=A0AA39DQL6_VITRO|nr:hypothetical protein PVL29_013014 [Vitis rotundifolia]